MTVFCDRVTLTFDLLTSGSMHAEPLPWSMQVPSLVWVAQAVFLLECGQTHRPTDKLTDATDHPIPLENVQSYRHADPPLSPILTPTNLFTF